MNNSGRSRNDDLWIACRKTGGLFYCAPASVSAAFSSRSQSDGVIPPAMRRLLMKNVGVESTRFARASSISATILSSNLFDDRQLSNAAPSSLTRSAKVLNSPSGLESSAQLDWKV